MFQVGVDDVRVLGLAVGGEVLGDPLLPEPELPLLVAQGEHLVLNLEQ